MRSPIIAFSLFVAVSPSLISAAPASPKLNGDSLTHARNTDLKLPQRFAVPRQLDDVMGSLPLGGQPSSPSGSNQGYKPGQPLPGDNTSPSSAQNHDPTGLTSKLNGDTPADKAAGTVSDPAAAIEEHRAPTEPTPPNGAGRSPELSTGNTLPNGDAHNGAVPATSRPLGEAPGETEKDEAAAGNIVS
ncbi:hypothetical protein BN946_scf184977.g102 [Trametes cinnabarina]|uniref:Uncharacterized protein n=1 Tax=Pycnoporus cinnabarinus TaxID=5643 RepID=A0A060SIZ8_PYCCI|nr:hypothetical protein BN946_scf184977.g102 [Trametes cinnabarina]